MNINLPALHTRMGLYARFTLAVMLLAAVLFGQGPTSPVAASTQTNIPGPAGSGAFGQQVIALPNGNIVVTDPNYSAPGNITAVGAVYLYNGATSALISKLTGSTAGDKIGVYGVTVLTNSNYVVMSALWHNGGAANAGAVTWGSGVTGVSGVVSSANSLVGATANDYVGGFYGAVALSSGNYVVRSPDWHSGSLANAGAATWGDGTKGVSGVVSASNSLVGSTAGDRVGYLNPSDGVTALSNGSYVVVSPTWSNGTVGGAGAVTWGNGATGIKGVVSAANSLVGSNTNDSVGINGVTLLTNGNYVVRSPHWQNVTVAQAGAATWGSGTAGVKGAVSATNSLVGSNPGDGVGNSVTALSNGNYVVASPTWDNTAAASAGAATWGSGATGIKGAVSTSNSLVGSTPGDGVGNTVTALSNGNYVVASTNWHNGATTNAGAVTWGNGATGTGGTVSAANSLVGSTAGDEVGFVFPLTNGNYVVGSYKWNNSGKAYAGAATWGSGASGVKGAVSAANSLVGSTAGDAISFVRALSNGNYVVASTNWHNGTTANAGSVTWGSGTAGVTGAVSAANSLVGATASDQVGYEVTALSNGNYVVASPYWHNGATANAGAVTWGSGTAGVKGVVSAANSLVGATAGDTLGCADSFCSMPGVTALSDGNYVVVSLNWHNLALAGAGAATWANGATGMKGVVSATNSLVGSTTNDYVGTGGVTALSNGEYVVTSPAWHNGATAGTGAVTLGVGAACSNGPAAAVGPITAANSVRGAALNGGTGLNFAYDPVYQQLVVGRPADNIVSLFVFSCSTYHVIFLPVITK